MEFAFGLERPVLFIDVPRKVNNQHYEELGIDTIEVSYRQEVGIVLPLDEINKVPEKIEILYRKSEIFQKKIKRIRAKNIYNLDESAIIGAKHIYDLITSNKSMHIDRLPG